MKLGYPLRNKHLNTVSKSMFKTSLKWKNIDAPSNLNMISHLN